MARRFHSSPIVERELRLSSRQWRTYWARIWIGAAGIVFGCSVLGSSPRLLGQAGRSSFSVLATAATLAVILKGVQLASQAFAREKREETLGLILLTPLSSLEIVLGKLLSSLVPAFYQFVAIVPVLALPILAGGVSAGEFVLLVIGLAHLAFLTVSVGLYYSTEYWHEKQAAWVTYVMLAVGFFLVPPVVSGIAGVLFMALLGQGVALFAFSPLFPIWSAASHHPASALELGASMVGVQGASWIYIRMTCGALRACCQKKAENTIESSSDSAIRWVEPALPSAGDAPSGQVQQVWVMNEGGGVRREFSAKERARLLNRNPALWLALRWRPSAVLSFLVGGLGLFMLWIGFLSTQFVLFVMPWFAIATCFFVNAGFKYYVLIQSSQALLPRNGEDPLQILLGTPLSGRELVEAHLMAIREPLVGKIRFLLWSEAAWIASCVVWRAQHGFWPALLSAIAGAGMLAMFVPDLKATAMHGLWQGVVSRNKREAETNTLLVLFIPWACAFLLMMVGGALLPPFGHYVLPVLGWIVCSFYVDRSFKRLAEEKLGNELTAWAKRRAVADAKPDDFWERTVREVGQLWKGSPQG